MESKDQDVPLTNFLFRSSLHVAQCGCVSQLYYNKIPETTNSQREKAYFGSQFWRLQGGPSLWGCGKGSTVEQNCLHHEPEIKETEDGEWSHCPFEGTLLMAQAPPPTKLLPNVPVPPNSATQRSKPPTHVLWEDSQQPCHSSSHGAVWGAPCSMVY